MMIIYYVEEFLEVCDWSCVLYCKMIVCLVWDWFGNFVDVWEIYFILYLNWGVMFFYYLFINKEKCL